MKTIVVVLFLIFNVSTFSQITAVTENGDTVLLKKDGTWEFKTEFSATDSNDVFTIDTNYTPFSKSDLARKVVKGQSVDYELWYDSDKWALNDTKINSSAEYILKFKQGEAYCMILPERVTLSTEGLLKIAAENAQKVAKDVKIFDKEMRIVNGSYVCEMKLRGETKGIKFIYYSYYVTRPKCTIQLITYTTQDLFDEYKLNLKQC